MQAIMAMLMGSAVDEFGDPPSGPPSNVGTYLYGGKIGIDWTNADPLAQTEVSIDGGATTAATVAPKANSWDSGETSGVDAACRHLRNGQYSSWTVGE